MMAVKTSVDNDVGYLTVISTNSHINPPGALHDRNAIGHRQNDLPIVTARIIHEKISTETQQNCILLTNRHGTREGHRRTEIPRHSHRRRDEREIRHIRNCTERSQEYVYQFRSCQLRFGEYRCDMS